MCRICNINDRSVIAFVYFDDVASLASIVRRRNIERENSMWVVVWCGTLATS